MDKLAIFTALAPTIAIVGVAGMIGWMFTTCPWKAGSAPPANDKRSE